MENECCKRKEYIYSIDVYVNSSGCVTCGTEVTKELNRYCKHCKKQMGHKKFDYQEWSTGDELWNQL